MFAPWLWGTTIIPRFLEMRYHRNNPYDMGIFRPAFSKCYFSDYGRLDFDLDMEETMLPLDKLVKVRIVVDYEHDRGSRDVPGFTEMKVHDWDILEPVTDAEKDAIDEYLAVNADILIDEMQDNIDWENR